MAKKETTQAEKPAKKTCARKPRAAKTTGEKATASRKTQGLFIRRLTVLKCKAPADAKVCVAGTFNDWNPEEKELHYSEKDCAFTGRIYLLPGEYEYKFVVNGEWILDENNPEVRDNGLNSFNNVLKIE